MRVGATTSNVPSRTMRARASRPRYDVRNCGITNLFLAMMLAVIQIPMTSSNPNAAEVQVAHMKLVNCGPTRVSALPSALRTTRSTCWRVMRSTEIRENRKKPGARCARTEIARWEKFDDSNGWVWSTSAVVRPRIIATTSAMKVMRIEKPTAGPRKGWLWRKNKAVETKRPGETSS